MLHAISVMMACKTHDRLENSSQLIIQCFTHRKYLLTTIHFKCIKFVSFVWNSILHSSAEKHRLSCVFLGLVVTPHCFKHK